jgi:hypothetical protein
MTVYVKASNARYRPQAGGHWRFIDQRIGWASYGHIAAGEKTMVLREV